MNENSNKPSGNKDHSELSFAPVCSKPEICDFTQEFQQCPSNSTVNNDEKPSKRRGPPPRPKFDESAPRYQLPERFRHAKNYQGYGEKINLTIYRTTSSDYGKRAPNDFTLPPKYYGFDTKFTTHLSNCGMYKNHSFNSKVE